MVIRWSGDGIEPTFKAWEALVLPLNYTRIESFANQNLAYPTFCIGALNQYIPFLRFTQKTTSFFGDYSRPRAGALITFTLSNFASEQLPAERIAVEPLGHSPGQLVQSIEVETGRP